MQMSIKETTFFDRGMEQLVAREAHNLEVVGSSPTPATDRTPATFLKDALRRWVVFDERVLPFAAYLAAGWSSW